MRSFNGDFTPWRCSRRQRRRGEGRHHPLGNKPRKKEFHHQELPWIRSLKRRKRSINVVVKAKMRKRWQMLEMKMMIAIKKPVLEFEYLDAQSL